MTEQQLPANLQTTIQPYLDRGYELVSSAEASAKLFRPKKKMGWWVAALNTGAYARNKDRTAQFQVMESGEVKVTGDTLDQLERDEKLDKGVNVFRYVLLGILLFIILSCIVLCFGSSLFGSS